MSPTEPDLQQPSSDNTAATQLPVQPTNRGKVFVLVGLVVFVVAAGITSYLASRSTTPASTTSSTSIKKLAAAQVSITGSGFVPASITVKPGQAIVWTNRDSSAHWIASDPYPADNALAGFKAAQSMLTNDSFSFIFNKVGTFTYHDNLNPYSIKGVVYVKQ